MANSKVSDLPHTGPLDEYDDLISELGYKFSERGNIRIGEIADCLREHLPKIIRAEIEKLSNGETEQS